MCETRNCGCIAAILGIILGIIVGVLFYLGTIAAAAITTPIIIALSIASAVLLLMIILLGASELSDGTNLSICTCRNAAGLVITSVLTIVAAIASFAITLAAGSVAIALLIAVGAGAFFAMLVLLVCWLICISQRNCRVIRD